MEIPLDVIKGELLKVTFHLALDPTRTQTLNPILSSKTSSRSQDTNPRPLALEMANRNKTILPSFHKKLIFILGQL